MYKTARPSRGLLRASISVNVSYQHQVTPAQLAGALKSGKLPDRFEAPIATLLDEMPLPVAIQAVEEAATAFDVTARRIWEHLAVWSQNLYLDRQVWQ